MEKTVQLFMLPYAGGNISSFNKLISCLDERIEAVTVEYSGRGSRRGEGYITGYAPFLVDIINYINAYRNTDLPYILFGYSMGSALVYDVIRSGELLATPILVIVCARGFVEHCTESMNYAFLEEIQFVEKVKQLGGIDDKILNNKRFLDIYLEPIKSDYWIWSQFKYEVLQIKINCDIVAFFCNEDTPRELVHEWSQITSGDSHFYEFGENHFFVNVYYKEMAKIINRQVLSMNFNSCI